MRSRATAHTATRAGAELAGAMEEGGGGYDGVQGGRWLAAQGMRGKGRGGAGALPQGHPTRGERAAPGFRRPDSRPTQAECFGPCVVRRSYGEDPHRASRVEPVLNPFGQRPEKDNRKSRWRKGSWDE